jgi:chemotaxis protein methyltransferase CheR
MPALSDRDFERFQAWIHAATGIYLAPVKKALLVARVGRRLRALGMDSFAGYFQLVSGPAAGAELDLFLDCITTHETRFFREPRQLEFLERQVLPAWSASAASGVRPRRVRAWSAGCATGEEPYSLAMLLLDQLPPSAGFAHEILATDLSQRVLEHGRAGIYPLARAGEIPGRYRDACMLRGTGSQQGRMRASPQLRALVRFQALNLNDADYAVGEPFDLILCRNVLIYFDPASRAAVIDRLISRLAAGGYLLLGHAESLREVSSRVRLVAPTVYTHAADPERGA